MSDLAIIPKEDTYNALKRRFIENRTLMSYLGESLNVTVMSDLAIIPKASTYNALERGNTGNRTLMSYLGENLAM
ncbi:hypothetical protein [uncultured Bacteroides sp.]|uniref:hypothetical protein n=1 Tax=uncultured Bacteroides sp. TaxID=162156 RepID=UPI002AAAD486|nr:hypothetical protein [uncultured Bacteroides sp.]